jgi:hypothetical protein
MHALEFPTSPSDPAALPRYLGGSLAAPRVVYCATDACHFIDAESARRFWATVAAECPASADAWGEPEPVELWRESAKRATEGAKP